MTVVGRIVHLGGKPEKKVMEVIEPVFLPGKLSEEFEENKKKIDKKIKELLLVPE